MERTIYSASGVLASWRIEIGPGEGEVLEAVSCTSDMDSRQRMLRWRSPGDLASYVLPYAGLPLL